MQNAKFEKVSGTFNNTNNTNDYNNQIKYKKIEDI